MALPDEWFNRTLPALLVQRFDDFLAVQGTVGFRVGTDAWTLVFGDVENPVRRGPTREAHLTLRFTPAAFDAFTEGTLDTAKAISTRDVSAVGDLSLLQTLSTFMLPLQRDNLGWTAE